MPCDRRDAPGRAGGARNAELSGTSKGTGVTSLVGQWLGEYQMEAELGRGTMGVVYRARHGQSGKPFAVKVLIDVLCADVTFVTRFMREILFDEKIAGTFHMALGASIPQSGGTNVSAVHWDMVCDLRPGGEIRVDGELLHKDGKFVIDF